MEQHLHHRSWKFRHNHRHHLLEGTLVLLLHHLFLKDIWELHDPLHLFLRDMEVLHLPFHQSWIFHLHHHLLEGNIELHLHCLFLKDMGEL